MTGHGGMNPLNDCLRSLSGAIGASTLYSIDHPQVSLLLPRIVDAMRLLAEHGPETLIFSDDLILYQGKPLEADLHATRVARSFGRRRIGYLRIKRGVRVADLRHLLQILAGDAAIETMKSHPALEIGAAELTAGEENEGIREIASVEELTNAELQNLQTFYDAVGRQEPVDIKGLTTMIAGFIAAFRREANPLLALAPLRMVDEYTFTHSVNVSILNLAQGMSLGIEGQLLHDLGVAGMLHDAGKVFVDREIINKSGRLNDAEWALIRRHPSRGAQYLLNQPGVPRLAVISAFEHHMRYDQKGYPAVSPGWQVNLASQMTMISDTFDALRTRRTYKDPWDFERICGHMTNLAGSQLNPDLTLHFLKVLGECGERQIAAQRLPPPLAATPGNGEVK